MRVAGVNEKEIDSGTFNLLQSTSIYLHGQMV